MFGCILAAAAAFATVAYVRRRRHEWSYGGPHGGGRCGTSRWHSRGWEHSCGGSRFGRAGVRRHLLRRVFERLEATPAQERVVLDAAEAIESAMSKQAEAARAWRGAMAQAFDGERFDRSGLDVFFSDQEKALAELRGTVAGKLAGIHEALEPDQRGEVARMIRNFGGWGRW